MIIQNNSYYRHKRTGLWLGKNLTVTMCKLEPRLVHDFGYSGMKGTYIHINDVVKVINVQNMCNCLGFDLEGVVLTYFLPDCSIAYGIFTYERFKESFDHINL